MRILISILASFVSFSLAIANANPLPFPTAVDLPDTPLSPVQRVVHVLNRLGFGPRPGEIQALVKSGSAGLSDWITRQLYPLSLPDTEVAEKLRTMPFWSMGIGQLEDKYLPLSKLAEQRNMTTLLKDDKKEARQELKKMVGEDNLPDAMVQGMTNQKLIRAVESPRQLTEVLTDFWFNHFNVDANKGQVKWYLASYERDVIRPHLFGRFRDLLEATAKSPAMQFYLDNMLSVKEGFVPKRDKKAKNDDSGPKRGLNENYARELMELHTLGVDGGYTQKDVREVARAFTGWGVEQPKESAHFVFREPAHDDGEKIILGTRIAAGGGIEDGEHVLDLLAQHPSTAKFIATKLCRRFVSDKPPQRLIDRVAKTFLVTDGDLRSVYLSIFTSPEFWSKDAYHAKIKSPFEFLVSAVRAIGGKIDTSAKVAGRLNGMGEALYRCQPPTGYKDIAEAWVNPGSLVQRIQLGVALAHGRIEGVEFDKSRLTELQKIADPNELIGSLNSIFFHEELSRNTKETILAELKIDEKHMPDGEIRSPEIAKYAGLFIGAPEFQRR